MIDEEIVSVKFNNGQFLNGVKGTLDALGGLKKGLNLDGATRSVQELDEAGKRFSLSGLVSGTQDVSGKFLAMATVGITALANITNAAINTGTQMAKALTIDPIKLGLQEYETNLNSIQTILANTSNKGGTLETVNAALQELNEYSDKTIYNFSEMARNIGTFTAAGVDLDTSTNAIKGIANLAAVSGSNSQQASTAMYQLSQALSTGSLKLMDWNSVVNAGMGGEVFQEALKETARAHGTNVDAIIKKQGSFRDSLTEGWITTEVLTETLSKFTGDLTDEQLKSMGYSQDQIVEIQKMAKTATDAATKVKTATQLMDVLKETAQSGWSQSFQYILGDFEQAKALFTGASDVLTGMINESSDARNDLLKGWNALGGRDMAIEAISNAFKALMAIIKPVKDAFREIFPPIAANQLAAITEAVRDFTAKLQPSQTTINNIKRVFKGLFAVLDIGWMVIKEVASRFGELVGNSTDAASSVLEFAAGIGDFLLEMRNAIKEGDGLAMVFDKIEAAIKKPLEFLGQFGKSTRESVGEVKSIGDVWSGITDAFSSMYEKISPIVDWVKDAFATVKNAVTDAFSGMDFNILVGLLNAGAIGAVALIIKQSVGGIPDMLKDILGGAGGGVVDTIKEAFGGLTGTMEAMQKKLQADTLIRIGIAIGIITASVVALSFIDREKIIDSLGAITIMFGQLMGTMAAFEKIVSTSGAAKMSGLAAALILLSIALGIFTGVVIKMSKLNWDELGRGLAGMAGGLLILVGAAKLLSGETGNLMKASLGILVISVALKVLASALAAYAALSWDEIARGSAAMTGLLLMLAGFSKIMGSIKGLASGSVGIVLISGAMLLLAKAMEQFSGFSWEELGKGLAGMAGALLLMSVALLALPPSTLASAAALMIVSVALGMVAKAMESFGGMSWEEIGKSLTMLAGSLLILAGAMYLMTAALPGAAALIVIAGALMLLVPSLVVLSLMSWAEIGTGLGALAAALGILAAAGIVMVAALPGLIGLGAAILLIGAGAALAGIGAQGLAMGLNALASAGAAGAAALKEAVLVIVGLIPEAMAAFAQGIIDFALVIAGGATEFTAAMTTLLTSLIMSIRKVGPMIIDTLIGLIMKLVDVLATNIPKFVDKGLQMVTGILQGIAKNIGGIVTAAIDIVTNFIDGIAKSLPKVVQSGINLIITFVESLADGIRRNTRRMENAGKDLASAIIEGMTGGITRGISSVVKAAKEMASRALNAAKDFLGINSPSKEFSDLGGYSTEGLALGLTKTSGVVEKAAEGVGNTALSTLKKSMSNMSTLVSKDMDMQPTIRPVLDLTELQRRSGDIGSMLTPPTLTPNVSYDKASIIAAESRATQSDMANSTFEEGRHITFIQNNNSPKALSEAEIYRGTKNQLSKMKGGLPE